MSKRNRGWRRAQRARMIQRALKTEMVKYWYYDLNTSPKDPKRQDFLKEIAARYCDRLAPCSCYACGNQRHNDWQNSWDMLTMQERRAYNRFIDQVEDYYKNGY
jgi:hypothetical protein